MPIDIPMGCQATITRETASTCFKSVKQISNGNDVNQDMCMTDDKHILKN